MQCPECRRMMRLFEAPGISEERWICDTEGCDIFSLSVKREGDYYK